MTKRIFLSTFEFSGDMHGGVLIRELARILPSAEFYGVGGLKMVEAGMKLVFDPTKVSTIGFIEALKNVRRLKKLIKEIVAEWKKNRPDMVLWLDSGGFNLVLAKEAKALSIPVVCMFSPSAWAYGAGRAAKLAERVRLLLAVLPFEADFYRKYGTNVTYVGHPLLDRVKNTLSPAEYREQHRIAPEEKLVALLPGSRRQEIAKLLPVMLEAISGMNAPSLKLVLPVAGSIDRNWLETFLAPYHLQVTLTGGNVYELLAAADAAVIASGTATLEAAILGAPMVIIYQVSKLSYFIYERMETPEHKANRVIGLPNLIAGRTIVPEVLQDDLNAENVRKALEPLLNDPGVNARIRGELAAVREKIGPPGVMKRAAWMIAELIINN
jgi:lipid-A-disaccharide synthase